MFYLFTDGGARGNPGPAAAGAFLFNDGKFLVDFASKYLGETTNNIAEYEALLLGLILAKKNNVTEITCHLDSELAVMQLNGAYQVKNQALKGYYQKIMKEKDNFKEIKFVHVLRARNKYADKMVNIVLDTLGK